MIRLALGRIDQTLGRVTMYRLVTLALTLIVVAAIGASALGWVGFGPLAILTHTGVLVAGSLVSGFVVARIARARAHLESSVITGLLLALILPPFLTGPGLGGAALAALLAAVSKYLLAWRGRHIVNPAAAASLAIGFTGLTFPLWWVGTPVLLPFVALGALAILWRTRLLAMGAVYVAVAGGILLVVSLALGSDPPSALGRALLSSPVVFVAGFMLSEPLTLPPRRWQRLLEAVVVGVIASTPITLATYSTAKPELALIVGNVLAFLFGQRRAIRLEFVGSRRLSPTAWEFEFRPTHPVRFRAGQYLELHLPHRPDGRGERRVFSLVSAPGEAAVRIGIRVPDRASSFKRALVDLAPGAIVRATGVGGDFVLPRDPARPLLLVAGGIGVTPFVSHLAEGAERDVVLVASAGSAGDLPYARELAGRVRRGVAIAAERPADLPDDWEWVGPGPLTAEGLLAAVPDAASRDVYLSGSPAMVTELGRALRRAGVRRIHTDVFSGY